MKQWAVLIRDWSYINMSGKKVVWKRGRRFKLSDSTYFNDKGDLCLLHWYCYGQSEIIPANYFKT